MTSREKAICEVFTGICFCAGDQRKAVYEYAAELLGRPIYTHEFYTLRNELREKAEPDFVALCASAPDDEALQVHEERLQACIGTMTYKEALERLNKHKIHHAKKERSAFYIQQALELACAAIEKQIPKAPKWKAMEGFDASVASHLCCPTCGEGVSNYWAPGTKPKRCQFCGQALDW